MVASYGPMIVATVFEVVVVAGLALALACRRIGYRLVGPRRHHGYRGPQPRLVEHGSH